MRIAILAVVLVAGVLSCSQEEPTGATPSRPPAPPPADTAEPETPSAPPDETSQEKLVSRGRSVYNQICIACHAVDPSQEGNIGPAIAGSPLALLEAKVLRNEYPPGYTPKRETLNMVPLPHMTKDLPALAAYLASAAD
jgi:mono/diheme cytochrome c family protein